MLQSCRTWPDDRPARLEPAAGSLIAHLVYATQHTLHIDPRLARLGFEVPAKVFHEKGCCAHNAGSIDGTTQIVRCAGNQ